MSGCEVVKIVIVDDHPVFRLGLKTAIEQNSSFIIIGEGAVWDDISGVLELYKTDVVFLDLMLGDDNSIEYIQRIKNICRSTKIVIISGDSNFDLIVKAFVEGADGYLSKVNSYPESVRSISSSCSTFALAC